MPDPLKTLPAASIRSNFKIVALCCAGIAESGMMPPMKYWELIADKLNTNGLVVGLSQRGSAAWLALEADAHTRATVAGTSASPTSC